MRTTGFRALCIVGVLVALAVWWWPSSAPTSSPADGHTVRAIALPAVVAAAPPPGTTADAAATRAPDTAIAATQGLNAAQLDQLRAALADHPQREAELARVAAYLRYAAQWEHFVARRAAGARSDELQPLARELDAGLDARLAQREVSAAEALQAKAVLLDVLLPDAASRQSALQAWRASHLERAPRAPDPQVAAFERRQSQIVAAWQALPEPQRDLQRLEAELEALRRVSFPVTDNPQGGKP